MELAQGILMAVAVYAIVGVVFALLFVVAGVNRVDAGAKGAGVLFRALIVPASAALWPLMLMKWARSKRGVH